MRKNKAAFNNQIQLGLKYFDDLEQKIPREEIAFHEVRSSLFLKCLSNYLF